MSLPQTSEVLRLRKFRTVSHLDDLQPPGDFFCGNQLPLPCPGTHLARMLPGFGRADVAFPEGPGPALPRTHGINGTALRAVEKNAIVVLLLAQGAAGRIHRTREPSQNF